MAEVITSADVEKGAAHFRKVLGMAAPQLSAAEKLAAEAARKKQIRAGLEREMAEHVAEGELTAEQRREREQHRAGAAWAKRLLGKN